MKLSEPVRPMVLVLVSARRALQLMRSR